MAGIGSVNNVARETSSYSQRRDQENYQLRAQIAATQTRLDSVESFLNVLAVGNPKMLRVLDMRQKELRLQHCPSDGSMEHEKNFAGMNPSNTYFDEDILQ